MRLVILAAALLTMSAMPINARVSVAEAAQPKQNDSLRVYLFEEFRQGVVVMDKTLFAAKLNYNMASRQIVFMDPDGVELEIADPSSVRRIEVDGRSFVYSDGRYLEILCLSGQNALGVERGITISDVKSTGAYGTKSSTYATTSANRLASQGQYVSLKDDKDIIYKNFVRYYISVGGGFKPATKRQFVKLYPKRRAEIESFTAEHKTDFADLASIEQLFRFLNPSE